MNKPQLASFFVYRRQSRDRFRILTNYLLSSGCPFFNEMSLTRTNRSFLSVGPSGSLIVGVLFNFLYIPSAVQHQVCPDVLLTDRWFGIAKYVGH